MSSHQFLAFDLGAESGRAILGTLESGKLVIKEISRFPNSTIWLFGHLYWNIFNLFEEIKKALKIFAAEITAGPESLAVDTWGVDFGLLARDGNILSLPHAYRDPRHLKAMEKFFEIFPKEKLYELTGIQFMPFNSIFQLYALALEKSALLDVATDLLFMPDLFTYLLSGQKTTEFTIASTSQLLNLSQKSWNEELLAVLGVSKNIMHKPLTPGTLVGTLLPQLSKETGLKEIPVVATAGHDTASAVAAVPASGGGWAYISSGTWSLMGIELGQPLITPDTLELNFTNEGGMEGTIRFLKNITGLWLVQQCKKKWSLSRILTYDELTELAASSPPFMALIDPDSVDFLNPEDMPKTIQKFCKRTKQTVPDSPPEIVRCILESLALKYRSVLEELRQVSPHPIHKIHIIGGGSRNQLLCQFTANATSLPVITGPIEATAMGNIMGQALALGYVHSLDEARRIIHQSTELHTYEPQQNREWDAAYERFQKIIALSKPS